METATVLPRNIETETDLIGAIEPCYLLVVRCSPRGGLRYERSAVEVAYTPEGEEVSEWDTTRTVADADERREASRLAGDIKRRLERLGRHTEFGVLIRLDRRDEVRETLDQARFEAEEFNKRSTHTWVGLRVVQAQVRGENEDVLRGLVDDLRGNLRRLGDAVSSADVKSIRDIARRLRGYDELLPNVQASALQTAIESARQQATEARRLLEEEGEKLASVQARMDSSPIDVARFALLDPPTEDGTEEASSRLQEATGADAALRVAGIAWGSQAGEEAPQDVAQDLVDRIRRVIDDEGGDQ